MVKQSARAKAAADKAKTEQEKRKKLSEASTLIDKQDIQESTKKKAKVSRGTVDERLISKMIRDNFKGWSPELTELTVRDGLSLRARLTQDKAMQLSGARKEPMGKLYYAELKSVFGSALSPDHLLVIQNDEEPSVNRLVAAMERLFSRKKSYDGIMAFLACADVLSQKNLAGLFKGCLMLSPSSTPDNNALAIALLEYCKRHDLKWKYPTETGVMRNYFQGAMVKAFLEFRKHDLTRMDFWHKYKGVLAFVLPVGAAEICFNCSGNWSDVEESLALVVESGELGRVLFGKAWGEVANGKVTALLKAQVGQLFSAAEVTAQTLQANLDELTRKVKQVGKDISDVFPEQKDVMLSFLGASVAVPAASALEEYTLMVWARLKEFGILEGHLQPIWGEHCLMSKADIAPFRDGFKVSESVLKDAASARKVAASYMDGHQPTCGEVSAALNEHGGFLVQMDKRFRLEKSYFEHMADEGGMKRLKAELKRCFPEQPGASASACSGRLAALVQGDLYKWVGVGGQTLAVSVLEMVRSLAACKQPQFPNANNACFEECRSLCRHFVSVVVPSVGEGAPPTTLYGRDAVLHMLVNCENRRAGGEALMYSDISTALAYSWLLDEAARRRVSNIAAAASSANDDLMEPSCKTASASQKNQCKKESGKSMVASLFKKGPGRG